MRALYLPGIALALALTCLGPAHAGQVGGGGSQTLTIAAKNSIRARIVFEGGEPAIVAIAGASETFLGCALYEENEEHEDGEGARVASDSGSRCVLKLEPSSRRAYRLRVWNRDDVDRMVSIRTN